METKLIQKIISAIIFLCLTALCCGDTFENIKSGETFNGFATQKVKQGKTFVYSESEGKLTSISLSDWRVTYNALGRRESIAVIRLDDQEVLVSKVVSDAAADAIIDSSNKGPLAIIVEIDLPGGRGEYAKSLSDAIKKTTNCPVIAFVDGGDDGGAYSAAAAVALACDKLYISSSAVLGSEAPMIDSGGYYGNEFGETFNSSRLAAYKGYVATLAERNGRPGLLAMAMVDSQIDVIEVSTKDGAKSFINRENRIPSQTILRAWSHKKTYGVADPGKPKEMSLVLQPNDAVYAKMADGIVESRDDILRELGYSDAKLLRKNSKIEKGVKKFIATRRNLSSVVMNIYYLQDRADALTTQLDELQKQSTTTTERLVDDGYVPIYKRPLNTRAGRLQYDQYQSPNTRKRSREIGVGGGTRVTETSPTVTYDELLYDLSLVLNDLTRDYNRALILGRRFPGALPIDMTVSALEKELYAAEALSNDIAYRR